MRVIGLMSGTSADAVDAALVSWPEGKEARPFELMAFCEISLGAELQARIHRLAAGRVPGPEALAELSRLDVELGERFAEAAAAVAEQAGVPLSEVDAIASHGQTVAHHPEHHASLQIGDPSVIAERTGCTTIADFRSRDLAAGGEGAPLAPFFHWAVMTDPAEHRLILNLGGIANLTWLPAGAAADDVVAFDVGPANSLMDGVVSLASDGGERFDRDGERAQRGRVDESLLAELLDDPYLRRSPPKSTGRERYGLAEAETLWERSQASGLGLDDLLATLVAWVAQNVGDATQRLLGAPRVDRLLVGGGGARNPALMAALAARGPTSRVEPFDAVGVSAAAAEAIAFSLMGRNARLGLANHLPQTTGARGARVLGELVPGS